MVVLVYLRMATVCVHQGSEAPPASGVRLTIPQPLLLAVQIWEPPSALWVGPTPISRVVIPVGRGQGGTGQGPPPSYHASLSSACPPGRYGKRCVPCKCNNHSSCHPSDGTCSCLAGWTGSDCSESMYQLVCGSAPAAWVTALWLLSGPGQRASLPQLSVT